MHHSDYTHCYPVAVALQEKLLEPENTNAFVNDDFLKEFAAAVGSKWPSLASLLSFSTAEIEQTKRDILGDPKEQALHMLRAWRRREDATYGGLRKKLKTISLFRK